MQYCFCLYHSLLWIIISACTHFLAVQSMTVIALSETDNEQKPLVLLLETLLLPHIFCSCVPHFFRQLKVQWMGVQLKRSQRFFFSYREWWCMKMFTIKNTIYKYLWYFKHGCVVLSLGNENTQAQQFWQTYLNSLCKQ